jgi:hypothetical protein
VPRFIFFQRQWPKRFSRWGLQRALKVWGLSRTPERKIPLSLLLCALHRLLRIAMSFLFRRTQRLSDHARMKRVRIKRGMMMVNASLTTNWKWLRHRIGLAA